MSASPDRREAPVRPELLEVPDTPDTQDLVASRECRDLRVRRVLLEHRLSRSQQFLPAVRIAS